MIHGARRKRLFKWALSGCAALAASFVVIWKSIVVTEVPGWDRWGTSRNAADYLNRGEGLLVKPEGLRNFEKGILVLVNSAPGNFEERQTIRLERSDL